MVDIIIPVYNARDTISKTLYSILLQKNLENIHVYLVDDASSCSYDDIVSFFSKKMDIHYYRLEKNSGPGAARQFGVDHSRSKYIMFCDSDDVLFDYYSVDNLVQYADAGKYDVTLGTVVEKYEVVVNYYPVRFDVLHAKLYRRSFLKKYDIRFPKLYNAEDLGFNNLILMCNPKLGVCDYDTVYVYVRREGSLTGTDDYYPEKHIRSYMDSVLWAVKNAEKNACKKEEIAKVIMESFTYFYFYFSTDYDNPSMCHVINNISLYDKYKKYIREEDREKSLGFWLGFLDTRKYLFSFEEFIAFCHEKAGESK